VAGDPDTELMLRLRAGDEAALRPLLERNAPIVLNLAFRYFSDRARAEDVVQETFLRVYRARERYEPTAPFRSYMLRIAANICISHKRKRRAGSLELGDDDRIDPADERAATPGAGLEATEMQTRVRDAVARLPERQRIAILLNKFEGLGYQEVADHLGLSVPATKSLLHRARMALKDMLAGYVEGEP